MNPTHILAFRWAGSSSWNVRLCLSLKEAEEHLATYNSGMYKRIGEYIVGEIVNDSKTTPSV